MENSFELGVTIKGEFHPVSIKKSPKEIFKMDPPWVGYPQENRKVSFTEYSNGQLVIVSNKWENQVQEIEIKKVGEISHHLLQEIMKKEARVTPSI
ncbi:hypothetical protein B7492_29895 (plasmid) [Bacillus mycoides]|uniref:Uncharacterized protein n=1 Tax=Bacillus mycoides TaxID=1405 RepID=A0A1W6AHJ8_BACMY|nr:hypothetical protein [Bacillus mycoides]ARJ25312.1 hypothetical protein B7492_29895 [Bacillus mycoides]